MVKAMRAQARRWAAIAAVLAIGVGATDAPAGSGGAENKAKSKIVLKKLGPTGANGIVSSEVGACEKGRKVSLFSFDGFRSDKVAITYTNSSGKWKVGKDLNHDAYFAKVDAAKANGVACLYDNSKTKRF
jgi:hypothetical protein